jgi:hypothetical protein
VVQNIHTALNKLYLIQQKLQLNRSHTEVARNLPSLGIFVLFNIRVMVFKMYSALYTRQKSVSSFTYLILLNVNITTIN